TAEGTGPEGADDHHGTDDAGPAEPVRRDAGTARSDAGTHGDAGTARSDAGTADGEDHQLGGSTAPAPLPGPVLGGPRDWDLVEDEDDGAFVPPTPGPVFGGDPLITMAWCGVLLAASTLLLLLFWPAMPRVLRLGALALLVGSFAVLLWRMPAGRDEEDTDEGVTF